MNTFLFIKVALIFTIIASFVLGIILILSFEELQFIGGFILIAFGAKLIIDLKVVFEVSKLHNEGLITKKEALNIILDSKSN